MSSCRPVVLHNGRRSAPAILMGECPSVQMRDVGSLVHSGCFAGVDERNLLETDGNAICRRRLIFLWNLAVSQLSWLILSACDCPADFRPFPCCLRSSRSSSHLTNSANLALVQITTSSKLEINWLSPPFTSDYSPLKAVISVANRPFDWSSPLLITGEFPHETSELAGNSRSLPMAPSEARQIFSVLRDGRSDYDWHSCVDRINLRWLLLPLYSALLP